MDDPPIWQYTNTHPINAETRIAELKQMLEDRTYAPEGQRANIEFVIQLYEDGVFPWPVGELVYVQDRELWEKPKRLPGNTCYWVEGVLRYGFGRLGYPENTEGQFQQDAMIAQLPEPRTDEERAHRELFLDGLKGKLVKREWRHKLRDSKAV